MTNLYNRSLKCELLMVPGMTSVGEDGSLPAIIERMMECTSSLQHSIPDCPPGHDQWGDMRVRISFGKPHRSHPKISSTRLRFR